MMTETQNPARRKVIQQFDDVPYRNKLTDFQRYLADCKRLMESERALVSQPDNAAPLWVSMNEASERKAAA